MKLKQAFSVKGFGQLDLFYQEEDIKGFNLENNKIKHLESDVIKGVGVRAIVKGKIGFSYTTNPQKLIDTVKQAIKLAKFSNQKIKLKSYPQYKKPKGIFDKNILNIEEKDIVKQLQDVISFVKSEKSILTEGGVNLTRSTAKYMNSEGLDLEEKDTFYSRAIGVNYKGTEGDWGTDSKNFVNDILDVAKKAVAVTKQLSIKGKIKTGKYDVIFHPFSLKPILSNGLYASFNADFVQKGKSKLAKKIGEKIFDEKLTINDNALLTSGLNSSSFDGDGTPSQDTILVKNGVVKSYLYDLIRAQKEKKQSTGNAVRVFSGLPAIGVTNFQIMLGKTKNIISEIDKGLLLYHPLNAHSINPITGDFSLGSMMSLWIEKGEIKYAPKNVMLSGNMFDLLKNIKLIGRDVMQVGSLVSPSIVAQTQLIGE